MSFVNSGHEQKNENLGFLLRKTRGETEKPKEVVDALRGFKQVTNFHISEYLVNGGMDRSRYYKPKQKVSEKKSGVFSGFIRH